MLPIMTIINVNNSNKNVNTDIKLIDNDNCIDLNVTNNKNNDINNGYHIDNGDNDDNNKSLLLQFGLVAVS